MSMAQQEMGLKAAKDGRRWAGSASGGEWCDGVGEEAFAPESVSPKFLPRTSSEPSE